MVENRLRISKSAYFPTIALLGKQTLYARNLPRNLMPRTLIGIGFTWNLFDGLNREADVRVSRLAKEKGLTIVGVKLYIADNGYAKLLIALARGKKEYDKRASIKEKDLRREMDRI